MATKDIYLAYAFSFESINRVLEFGALSYPFMLILLPLIRMDFGDKRFDIVSLNLSFVASEVVEMLQLKLLSGKQRLGFPLY